MASTVFLLAVLQVSLFALSEASGDKLLANTTAGVVRGYKSELNGTQYRVFGGIPYAEPPVGPLRFSPPVAKSAWDASVVLNTTSYGKSCLQNADTLSDFVPEFLLQTPIQALDTSEDCLTLNVYTPYPSSDNATDPKWAVLVWFHGGSYRYGKGSAYDASALALKGGIVVVTINYRLGPFGFLQTGDDKALGNFGLRDQQLALQWVKYNIKAFGGDPSRVTLSGQAGVHGSATLHMFANNSRQLFQRVAAHSGVFRSEDLQKPADAVANTELFAELAGCSSSEALVDCLRNKSANEILSYNLQLSMKKNSSFVWRPVFTLDFFTMQPGDSVKYDLLSAFNTGDGSIAVELIKDLFLPNAVPNPAEGVTEAQWDKWLNAYIDSSTVVGRAVEYKYTDNDMSDKNTARLAAVVNAQSGRGFGRYGSSALRELQSMLSSTRVLIFDHRSSKDDMFPESIPAPHGSEVPYLFGLPFDESRGIGGRFTSEERKLSHRMIRYWSNFAKTGDPNMSGGDDNASSIDPTWPLYDDASKKYLKLKLEDAEVSEAYRSDDIYFWDEYVPELKAATEDVCPMRPDTTVSNPAGVTTVSKPAGVTTTFPVIMTVAPPECPDPVIGKGMGLALNVKQAEALIQALLVLCLIVFTLAVLVLVVGAVYKPKPKAVSKEGFDAERGAVKTARTRVVNGGLHGDETGGAGTSGSSSQGGDDTEVKGKTILNANEPPIYSLPVKSKHRDQDETKKLLPENNEDADHEAHVYANVAYRNDADEVDEDSEHKPEEEEEEVDIDEIFPPPPADLANEGAEEGGVELEEIPPPYDEDEDDSDDPSTSDDSEDLHGLDSETEVNTKL